MGHFARIGISAVSVSGAGWAPLGHNWKLARPAGFEPAASTFGGWHSIQLSYGRFFDFAISIIQSTPPRVFEMTQTFGGRHSIQLSYGRIGYCQAGIIQTLGAYRQAANLNVAVQMRHPKAKALIFRNALVNAARRVCLNRCPAGG